MQQQTTSFHIFKKQNGFSSKCLYKYVHEACSIKLGFFLYFQLCPSGWFTCQSGGITCIQESFKCDCSTDCDDGSDESATYGNCTLAALCENGAGKIILNIYYSLLFFFINYIYYSGSKQMLTMMMMMMIKIINIKMLIELMKSLRQFKQIKNIIRYLHIY